MLVRQKEGGVIGLHSSHFDAHVVQMLVREKKGGVVLGLHVSLRMVALRMLFRCLFDRRREGLLGCTVLISMRGVCSLARTKPAIFRSSLANVGQYQHFWCFLGEAAVRYAGAQAANSRSSLWKLMPEHRYFFQRSCAGSGPVSLLGLALLGLCLRFCLRCVVAGPLFCPLVSSLNGTILR